ncbi:fumarylacetoacetate hydrolase family protein [Rhodococcus opacus]|uniref:fumarylacetoacetate hydrolase family protein n=1 Tax=Rhodococcus opacus TaxID=37919 RepID=UPI001C208222|nr:fumarylacetoacetate hydrolase family protein [Rhodococcus opacus]
MVFTPARPALASIEQSPGTPTAVVVHGSRYVRLGELAPALPTDLTVLLRQWDRYAADVEAIVGSMNTVRRIASNGVSTDYGVFGAPVRDTSTYCAIGNYRGQLMQAALDTSTDTPPDAVRRRVTADLEMRRASGAPFIALTGSARARGTSTPIALDDDALTLDWEAELAVIIGRRAWQLPRERAMSVVAGYSIANDLTLRGAVFRDDVPALGGDWLASKARPGSLPLGPLFVPATRATNPDDLAIQLKLNGEIMQSDRTSDMLFGVVDIISHISQLTPLLPGDVVCTGSPAGFGSHYGRYLRPHDEMEIGIEGLGSQRTRVASARNRSN